jgi:hypothetical protein
MRPAGVGQGETTSFTCDGNGALVKKVVDGQTTVCVGNYHEKNVTTGQVTKYYFFGSQRIAMRKAGVVQYVLGDHLSSTTLVLDQNGAKVDEIRYREASRSVAEWITPTVRSAGPWTAPFQPIIASPGRNMRPGQAGCTRWALVGMS